MALSQRMETVLRELYHPDGINLGMNIGKAAGAGIAGHIHMHVLPRWVADANFVSVVGETRVLPETLEVTWGRMREAMGVTSAAAGTSLLHLLFVDHRYAKFLRLVQL